MNLVKPCIFNWSGGKDSALALYHCLQDRTLDIRYLVTTVADDTSRITMHGVRASMLIRQAESIGIPLYVIRLPATPGIIAYNETMARHLEKLKEEGITHAIYGDIFLEDLKTYREQRLAEVGMSAVFPLWGRDTRVIMTEFLDLDFQTVIVCANEKCRHLVGKVIDPDVVSLIPSDIDICGENGEYHTFTFNGPVFKQPVSFKKGELFFKEFEKPKDPNDNCFLNDTDLAEKDGYWYLDLY